ncbi:MAG: DUF262 domain-containing protein [Acinetobacter sp.]|nr:DUF262 domain-containing protein [Acinetobacter sp.]
MIRYQVRSIQLLNLINDVSSGKLIPEPFFQRNLVWREVHKRDFIETILMGFPFPQIFISKGKIDLINRISTSCIVDGQQRCNAIQEYIEDKFSVDGKFFSQLNEEEQSEFFKYEVAVIELDLAHDDPKVGEIFQRINRTSNALTGIEKKASEYSSSEFMLVSQYMSDHLVSKQSQIDDLFSEDVDTNIKINPNIDQHFLQWIDSYPVKKFSQLINDDRIFTKLEISKKVNLMYTMNLVSTYIHGIYTRNDEAWNDAELYKEDFNLKDVIVERFEKTADLYLSFRFNKKSFWFKKANFFSLFYVLAGFIDKEVTLEELKVSLNNFEPNDEYRIAAKEGVNNAKERSIRNDYIIDLVSPFFS